MTGRSSVTARVIQIEHVIQGSISKGFSTRRLESESNNLVKNVLLCLGDILHILVRSVNLTIDGDKPIQVSLKPYLIPVRVHLGKVIDNLKGLGGRKGTIPGKLPLTITGTVGRDHTDRRENEGAEGAVTTNFWR